MRLSDLAPRWVTGIRSPLPETAGKRGHVGVTFLCPHCRETRLGVMFKPPIDDGVLWLFESWGPIGDGPRWERTGEDFNSLTLAPSIDASQHGHWHGFITDGEVR